ncbi:MAG TPA: outer membrane beta-barrel protein [Tepidisphaeraceae bacterium]
MNALDKMGMAKGLDDLGINIYGWVQGSWTYNFADPAGDVNVGRFFDFEHDDHTLNQVVINIEKAVTISGDKFDWGGKMEWMWGGDARFIHANGVFDHYGFPLFPGSPGTGDGPDEQFDPSQFYLQANIPWGNGLLLTGGKFWTLLGYEVVDPLGNFFYSHSFMFAFAIPITNTGGMAKYQLNKNWSVTGAIVRGWDQSFEDNNGDALSYMGQVAYNSEKFDFYATGITGPEQVGSDSDYRSVLDLIAVYRYSDQLTFAANSDIGYETDAGNDGSDACWWGIAGYATYKINDMFSAGLRAEYFSDEHGARGLDTSLTEVTAGLNIKPFPNNEWGSGLYFRPEVRWDWAQDDIFNGFTDDNQFTIAGDIIYAF